MADYYPLLARAVANLEDNTPEARQAIYDRAFHALQQRLASFDPPLDPDAVKSEQDAFQHAINTVEGEYLAPAPEPDDEDLFQDQAEPPTPVSSSFAPPAHNDTTFEEPPRERPRIPSSLKLPKREVAPQKLIVGGALGLSVLAIALVALWLKDQPRDPARMTTPEMARPAAPEGNGKITERLGSQGTAPSPAPAQPAAPPPASNIPVAQRAALFEENETGNDQQPKVTLGRAIWKLDAINPGQGQALETALKAELDLSEVGLGMVMTIRKNKDQTLPASHLVEIVFRPSNPERKVRDISPLFMKVDEQTRGTPLAGVPYPLNENLFVIALSNLSTDVERNTALLTQRPLIELQLRYANGKRAAIVFEKGFSGEQVIAQAFQQWR